ncbi:MAG: AAA family ATPase, partial [Ardenticatenaceae bacterium]|nr:AAA family ATPase [Ardenticatenaceae bacterium]
MSSHHPLPPPPSPFPLRLILCLLLTTTYLLLTSPQANAQTPTDSYWQYPIRLRHLTTADITHNGIDEFIAVDESGAIELIAADGRRLWRYPNTAPVLVISTANTDTAPQREIIFATADELVLLTADGSERWRIPITPIAPPPSLLLNGSEEAQAQWLAQYHSDPIAIAPFHSSSNAPEQILLLLASGQVQRYDAAGTLQWRYTQNTNPTINTQPQMIVQDVDTDGRDEIILGRGFGLRRFSQLIFLDDDTAVWDRPIDGRLTALTLITFADQTTPFIAVGNNQGQLQLFDKDRQPRVWLRTLNHPITSLTAVQLPSGPALAAATNIGRIVTYNHQGIRQWTAQLAPDANRSITRLISTPHHHNTPRQPGQPALAALLAPSPNSSSQLADIILLSGNSGATLRTLTAVDQTTLSQLTDINHDQQTEVAIAGAASLQLLGLGIGANKNTQDWQYNLRAQPNAYLSLNIDDDRENELLIGAEDGRLHLIDNDGTAIWITPPGDAITHLATVPTIPGQPPHILITQSHSDTNASGETITNSQLRLQDLNNLILWQQTFPSLITDLLITDLNNDDLTDILLATNNGSILNYDRSGSQQWQTTINEPIQQILTLPSSEAHSTELLAVTTTQIYHIRPFDPDLIINFPIATYSQPIRHAYPLNQPGRELATAWLALTDDENVHGHNWRGIQLPQWPVSLGGSPITSLPANDVLEEVLPREEFNQLTEESFLIATNASQLLRLNIRENQPSISWRISGMDNITALYWGDLDGDILPDIAAGSANGRIRLFTRDLDPIDELELVGGIFALTVLRSGQQTDLLAITDTGIVQRFRGQENRPPLLTNIIYDMRPNQYSLGISVQDVEGDDVLVQPEIFDPAAGEWQPQGEEQLASRSGPLFWPNINVPTGATAVQYRFHYNDGFHEGIITPPSAPAPILIPPRSPISTTGYTLLGLAAAATAVLLLRQSQTPAARARRFQSRLRQQPLQTLILLEQRYTNTEGSPDFLLNLAGQARQRGNYLLASLADGIYLLADQPDAGLTILLNVLDEVKNLEPKWTGYERWLLTYRTCEALLNAPSITELSLLRPRLVELLDHLDNSEKYSPILDALLPILTNLRDSERVDLAEDRLVYLNEAALLLRQLQLHLTEFPAHIEKALVRATMRRWVGLVNAEIELLRGRAELTVTLKTKRLIPTERTEVVLIVQNNGRAAAENVIIILDENPAYTIHSDPQIIPTLLPNRDRQISFTIEPKINENFRISLTLTYDDRNQQDKVLAFGDMVHLLPPTREFRPIPNPYMPGTPLRQNSPIFVGRKHLFNFIAENIGQEAQRNVLMLIGQRRTGKTSVLLRLDQHLPPTLLPVYVDCQSLGITPGMPAFLHDIAWLIADALANRDIEIDVPDIEEWQHNPTGRFRRQFLTQILAQLPSDTTLVFVFDEFEAIEQLVTDKILPPTIFPYLRHLMQHSERLGFIFVGTSRLEEMSADYWSVLFNIALYQKISYLRDESAIELITRPVAPDLVYDDLALDKILRVTAGHPYFVQLVCYTLIKRANAQRTAYVTISDVNAALDEMLRLGEVHFAYLWQRSSFTERAILTAVSHLLDPDRPFHAALAAQQLEGYNIHLDPHDVTLALNTLVERDIMREITEQGSTLYQLKIG